MALTQGFPHEDAVTKKVDQVTGQVPGLAYVGLALGAMAASAALVLSGRKELGNFIGQWAPSILIVGLYNKIVKQTYAAA